MNCKWLSTIALMPVWIPPVGAQTLSPPPQDFVLRVREFAVAYNAPIPVTPSLTLETWVSIDTARNGTIMGRPDYYLGTSNGAVSFCVSTGSGSCAISPTTTPLNTWTHVAGAFDAAASRFNLYIDGVLVRSQASVAPPSGQDLPFGLGGRKVTTNEAGGGSSIAGAMRQARVWSRALTAAEIRTYATQTLTGAEPGLLAAWPLDDGAGLSARDIGPNHYDATLVGGVDWSSRAFYDSGPYWEIVDYSFNIPSGLGVKAAVYRRPDGHSDVLAAFSPYSKTDPAASGPVYTFRHQGNRTWALAPISPASTTQWPRNRAVADFNGDGLEDVVIADSGMDGPPYPGGITRIFIQQPSGEMRDETSLRLTTLLIQSHDVCSADVNGDGSPDLLYSAIRGASTLWGPKLFLNDGRGYFTDATQRLPASLNQVKSPTYTSCKFADVNRDGAPDLLLGSWPNASLSNDRDTLLLNEGNGNFRDVTAQAMPLRRSPQASTYGFAPADYNRDGWLDLIVIIATDGSATGPSSMQLLINNRDGTFRDQADAALNAIVPQSPGFFDNPFTLDLNKDGWADLVVPQCCGAGADIGLYQNMGGRFERRSETYSSVSTYDGLVADFDGDGMIDLLNFGPRQVRVMYGKKLFPAIAGAPPIVNNVVTAGGFPGISQNAWIEIRGLDLAPQSVPAAGMVWSSAPSFASGQMPTDLGGVSVTVNGKPAFVYFVSASQVNVLAPLDSATGTVDVIVTSGGVSSAPFRANKVPVSPSFPLVGSGYIVSTHTDFSLVGPASLSSPGYPFTPAKPGETILLFAFGFGLPSTTLINGSSSQTSTLPALPVVQFGGLPAPVSYAGVISPGLYQLNVVVPVNAPGGDNIVSVTYAGASAPGGTKIAVQR